MYKVFWFCETHVDELHLRLEDYLHIHAVRL